MNRTTVSLEPTLFRRLKEEAARQGKTFQECVNAYLRLGLESFQRRERGKGHWRLPVLALGRPKIDPADREAIERLDRRP